MRRVTLIVGVALTVAGLALYLSGSPSLNQSPVSHGGYGYDPATGYGYANCPIDLTFDAGPDGVLKGGTVSYSGRLVPETGADVASETINIRRIPVGSSTDQFVETATTNSSGNFSGSFILSESSTVFATWEGADRCSDTDQESNHVLVRVRTFFDVPVSHFAYPHIEQIAAANITAGCHTSPPLYCPDSATSRGQMAVFILKSIGHDGHLPAYRGIFADVPSTHPFARFIEHLWDHGFTSGCDTSPRRFCPNDRVTRGQMAVFILRAMGHSGHLTAYRGIFADVPSSHQFALFIEHFSDHGITAGCATSPARYCPDRLVTRAQMAVFLVNAFDP